MSIRILDNTIRAALIKLSYGAVMVRQYKIQLRKDIIVHELNRQGLDRA